MALIASISEKIGALEATTLVKPRAKLRKRNRIKTIQASLEIEGNTLNIEQVTDLLLNKRVLGPQKDILEVKNAIEVYSKLQLFNVNSLDSLKIAHKILMKNLVRHPGEFRKSSAGIAKGDNVTHVAPPAEMVNPLMKDLFKYIEYEDELLLIKSCVFHYELEFIHPFEDGNGRMGRLWQTLILMQHSLIFEFLPVESLIRDKQNEYYEVLGKSDKLGHSTLFIEFMLQTIDQALMEQLNAPVKKLSGIDRIESFRAIAGANYFSRKNYMMHFKEISSATASRDLKNAFDAGILDKVGEKNATIYQYK